MALHLGGVLLGVWLIACHGVSAETSEAGATSVVEDATCERQLETMTSALQKAQKTKETRGAPLAETLLESPGDAHWPASRSAYVPPLVEYFYELQVFLRSWPNQWQVAVVAGVFGMINLVNGPISFKMMILAAFSLVGAASAQYEAKLLWPSLNVAQQIAIAAEGGLLSGFVMFRSIQGATTLLGLLFGLSITVLLEPFFHTELWQLNMSLGWYSAWALMGVLLLTFFQRRTLSLLTPCLGGFLLSSCVGYLTQIAVWCSFHQPNSKAPPDWVIFHGDCWLDFAGALLGTSSAGIFGITPTPGGVAIMGHQTLDLDRCLGRLLWFVLFYVGLKYQMSQARNRNWDGSYREPLLQKDFV